MFSIIGKRYSPSEFAAYVKGLTIPDTFKPQFVVLHNTAVPSLAQRPAGFSDAHMKGLQSYYASKSWNGGPHLFVDDHGIWVFNPLTKRGTHSPSWNGVSFGVEMLGDFETEPFTIGRGAKVAANAAAAIVVLLQKIGQDVTDKTIRLHKEDPGTDHDCPGKNVKKSEFLTMVKKAMEPASVVAPGWTVQIGDKTRVVENGDTSIVRFVGEALGASLTVDADTRTIRVIKPD